MAESEPMFPPDKEWTYECWRYRQFPKRQGWWEMDIITAGFVDAMSWLLDQRKAGHWVRLEIR